MSEPHPDQLTHPYPHGHQLLHLNLYQQHQYNHPPFLGAGASDQLYHPHPEPSWIPPASFGVHPLHTIMQGQGTVTYNLPLGTAVPIPTDQLLLHPSAYFSHIHPQHLRPPHAEAYIEALPSPLCGTPETDHTSLGSLSRPPTRNSLAHSRQASTATSTTASSAHSGASEYQPAPSKSKSRVAPKRKAKKQAAAAGSAKSSGLGRPKRIVSAGIAAHTLPPSNQASEPTRRKAAPAPVPPPDSPATPAHSSFSDDIDPPPDITAENVKYPLLAAPLGTTYSINNFVILIPAHYAPPHTDIKASEFEQYTCRLCRKTYTGKNARSVARRHLQDKHMVRLELQERRSRWDRSNVYEPPKDEVERKDRDRAAKAIWARKHRQAEKERIEAALRRDLSPPPKKSRKGSKKGRSAKSISAAGAGSRAGLADPEDDSMSEIRALYGMSTEEIESLIAGATDSPDQAADMGEPSAGGGRRVHRTLASAENTPTRPILPQHPPKQLTESPLSSSPDPTALGVHQDWVPDGWDDPSRWSALPPQLGAVAALAPAAHIGPLPSGSPPSDAAADDRTAELAAQTLLNIQSTPVAPLPRKGRDAYKGISRPTPFRRFTLGSSSSSGVLAPTSSALSIGMSMSMTDAFPSWPHILDTPISLRPRGKRTSAVTAQGQVSSSLRPGLSEDRTVVRGRLAAGERSLSFSTTPVRAGMGLDDPFVFSPAGVWGTSTIRGKENAEEQLRGGKGGKRGQGMGVGDLGSSPVPMMSKRPPLHPVPLPSLNAGTPSDIRTGTGTHTYAHPTPQPLGWNAHAHAHHSSSSLSSTLIAPSTSFHQPNISPLKRLGVFATPATRRATAGNARFGASASVSFSKTPGRGGAGMGVGADEERSGKGWMLSSPAGDGVAAELGLVGAWGYGSTETPMRGVVGAETPVRERERERQRG